MEDYRSASLLKYDEPVLVSTMPRWQTPALRTCPCSSCSDDFTHSQGQASSVSFSPQLPTSSSVPPPPSPKSHIPEAKKNKMEILDVILPPKKWSNRSGVWLQRVSSAPNRRMDVTELNAQLNIQLQKRHAQKKDICDVRREVYAQCFDELIRQVTVDCSVRGQLLARIRDEIRLSMDSYLTLDDRIKAFGIRKLLDAEQERAPLKREILDLEKAKMALEQELSKAEAEYEAANSHEMERQAIEDMKREEELQRLTNKQQQLKSQLNK